MPHHRIEARRDCNGHRCMRRTTLQQLRSSANRGGPAAAGYSQVLERTDGVPPGCSKGTVGTHRYSPVLEGTEGAQTGCSQGTVGTQLTPLLPQAGIGRKWESAVSANRRGAHGVLPGYCEYSTKPPVDPRRSARSAARRNRPIRTIQRRRARWRLGTASTTRVLPEYPSGVPLGVSLGMPPEPRRVSWCPWVSTLRARPGWAQLGLFLCLFVWLFASSFAACGRPRASVCVPHIAHESGSA